VSRQAIAITGSGLITPLGDDPRQVMENLRAGQRALPLEGAASVTIPSFEATRYAAVRGMRAYSRTTQLGIAAAAQAMADAKLREGEIPPERFGLVMASTYGHLDTLLEYDFGLITKGMERTNPALMPLAIGSAPGAATALGFRLRGASVTLSAGAAAGLDAVGLASRLVASGRLQACLVVGAFSAGPDVISSATGSGFLVAPEHARAFDRDSRGVLLAESACALVIETLAGARERSAQVQGIVLGHAGGFAAQSHGLADALAETTQRALSQAELKPGDVSLICSGANGHPLDDEAQAHALCAMFYAWTPKPPVLMAPKASLGESMDAGGLLQVLTGLSALRGGMAPMIPGLEEPRVSGPRYARQTCRVERGTLLALANSRSGSTSALLLGTELEPGVPA
jgi:3-oxoacyl-[acyl-carrier-protein] synthase II